MILTFLQFLQMCDVWNRWWNTFIKKRNLDYIDFCDGLPVGALYGWINWHGINQLFIKNNKKTAFVTLCLVIMHYALEYLQREYLYTVQSIHTMVVCYSKHSHCLTLKVLWKQRYSSFMSLYHRLISWQWWMLKRNIPDLYRPQFEMTEFRVSPWVCAVTSRGCYRQAVRRKTRM